LSARLEFRPYRLPLAIPYRWAKGVQTERAGALARCEIDGAVGWGEAAPSPEREVDGPAFAAEGAAMVAGLDPAAGDFLDRLDARGVRSMRLRCAAATAWLSARAAAAGTSLAAFLAIGNERPAAFVPVNGIITEATPEDAAARARTLVAAGMRTLKIKCTENRAGNLARVAAIRAAAPTARLRLDANEGWPAAWSLDHLKEPLARATADEALAAYARAAPVRVALDESIADPATARRLIARGAAHVLILKAPRLGGPDRVLTVARMAAAAGVASTITVSLETAVGTAAAVHAAALLPAPIPDCGLGMSRFFARDVCPPPALVGGRIAVPQTPGLGVDPEPFWRASA
jgi:L-alanine-DL-glutamate epimerase-like enolase superfamily enzyme